MSSTLFLTYILSKIVPTDLGDASFRTLNRESYEKHNLVYVLRVRGR